MENGRSRMEGGGWRMQDGARKIENWKLMIENWRLITNDRIWRMEYGGWKIANKRQKIDDGEIRRALVAQRRDRSWVLVPCCVLELYSHGWKDPAGDVLPRTLSRQSVASHSHILQTLMVWLQVYLQSRLTPISVFAIAWCHASIFAARA